MAFFMILTRLMSLLSTLPSSPMLLLQTEGWR
jgi:hypothetical protein